MIDIIEDTFVEEVVEVDILVLVEFYTTTCVFCKRLEAVLLEIEKDYKDRIKICRVNAEENTQLMRDLCVGGIPTTKLFMDGTSLIDIDGYKSKSYIGNILDQYLNLL